jgi:Cu+-exporting ATPase
MATTKDPVCGMSVQPEKAAGKSEYQGETFHFCSTGCKHRFDQAPQNYIQPAKAKSWLSWLTGK